MKMQVQKKILMMGILFIVMISFAGQTSLVSASFLLNDNGTDIESSVSLQKISLSLSAMPNPFNPSTSIFLTGISKTKSATLRIFNIHGQVVGDLSSKITSANSPIIWNAKSLPGGVYLAKLTNDNKSIVCKMLLIK